jgi:ribosomal protein S18 acetylase RimI-like enzyme
MSEGLQLRKGSPGDLLLLQKIGREAFADTFSEYNTEENMREYLDKHYAMEKIAAELQDPNGEFLLVFDGKFCAGYARMRKGATPNGVDGNAIEIERLYAVRNYIGKEVGKKLMEACVEYAIQGNFDIVWLGVWEKNIRAIRFYEKHGFRKFGEHVFMLGQDAQNDWLMKKML